MNRIKKKFYNFFLPHEKKHNVKNCYITCAGRNDGLGAQIQSILSVILVAKQYNLVYVHTPIQSLDHVLGEEEFFENFFNLGKNEISIDEINDLDLNIKTIKHPSEIQIKSNTLYITQGLHQYADKFPNSYLNIMSSIRKKFFDVNRDKLISVSTSNKLSVALHVRRGDVNIDINSARYTGNLYYKEILNYLYQLAVILEIELDIHLYSQGKVEDFQELDSYDITYHLDECLATTFLNLVNSDILVMSKSSLSYCSALLSENIKIYQEFWHKPLDEWIQVKVINDKVWIDENKLEEKIKSYKD